MDSTVEPNQDTVLARLQPCAQRKYTPVAKKHAAVLVPLFHDEQGCLCVVLTKRSKSVGSHQGEVCLPGGKQDPNDADDAATALREAWEELGLPSEAVRVVASLPPVLSKHFLSVAPVVGFVPPSRAAHAPCPSAREVAAVFHAPLALFVNGGPGHTFQDILWEGHTYRIHSFKHGSFNIWGLTAGILIQVAQLAFGRPPTFVEHAPPEMGGVTYGCFRHDGHKLCVALPDDSRYSDRAAQPDGSRGLQV